MLDEEEAQRLLGGSRCGVRAGYAPSVLAHEQIVKDGAHVAVEAAQTGDIFRAVAAADATAILIEVPVDDVVAAVFYRPVAAVDLQEPLRGGLGGGAAGDAVGELAGEVAGFLGEHLPLDEESLGESGEVEVSRQGAGRPDGAGLDAPVARGGLAEVGARRAVGEV